MLSSSSTTNFSAQSSKSSSLVKRSSVVEPRFDDYSQNNTLVVANIGDSVALHCRIWMKQVNSVTKMFKISFSGWKLWIKLVLLVAGCDSLVVSGQREFNSGSSNSGQHHLLCWPQVQPGVPEPNKLGAHHRGCPGQGRGQIHLFSGNIS